MTDSAPATEQTQALHRGLSIRIGVALAILAAVAIFAVYALMRSESETLGASAGATDSPGDVPHQPQPAASMAVVEAPSNSQTEPAPGAMSTGEVKEAALAANEHGAANASDPPTRVRSEAADGQVKQPEGAATAPPASVDASSLPPANRPAKGPRLQAGVFLQASNAQAVKAELEAQGYPVYIESRVHVGPFRNRKEAERAREKLREKGVTTVLIAQ